MNTTVSNKAGRKGPAAPTPGAAEGDVGEIHTGFPDGPPRPVVRVDLSKEEEKVSLPPQFAAAESALAPLNRFLGPSLTHANLVWGQDPIWRLRGLQKRLVEHSLTLDQSDRSECMAALSVVEAAVQLRLRFQQMCMNEEEMAAKTTGPKATDPRSEAESEQ